MYSLHIQGLERTGKPVAIVLAQRIEVEHGAIGNAEGREQRMGLGTGLRLGLTSAGIGVLDHGGRER